MRYATPVEGRHLAQHFGHCEQFALIDADEERKEMLRKEVVPSPGHQPGLLPQWLAEQGVSVVISLWHGLVGAKHLSPERHLGGNWCCEL